MEAAVAAVLMPYFPLCISLSMPTEPIGTRKAKTHTYTHTHTHTNGAKVRQPKTQRDTANSHTQTLTKKRAQSK